jgi:broad specificity phosphatase PhoE
LRIILVSHGENIDVAAAMPRHSDPGAEDYGGLTTLGRRQALALAYELKDKVARRQPIERLYAADAAAALATASILGRELQLPEAEPLAGLVAPPAVADAFAELEALRGVEDGAWSAIERLRDSHADEAQVIAVAPLLTVRAIVCRALSLPVEGHRRFRVDAASLTILSFRQQRTILQSLNETCHLENLPD